MTDSGIPATDPRIIHAPWSSEQVEALNLFQRQGGCHPFTCGASHPLGQNPVLDATHSGWVCPDPACEYTQDWASIFMIERGRSITRPPAATALAEDLRYVLNYRGPGHEHDRPGFWDTSGKPCDHCARLAVAQKNLAEHDKAQTAPTELAAIGRTDSVRHPWGPLGEAERRILTFALDEAQEIVWSRDGFTEEDQKALDALRALAEPAAVHVAIEEQRSTLSRALCLGTGAPWEAIGERLEELGRTTPCE